MQVRFDARLLELSRAARDGVDAVDLTRTNRGKVYVFLCFGDGDSALRTELGSTKAKHAERMPTLLVACSTALDMVRS